MTEVYDRSLTIFKTFLYHLLFSFRTVLISLNTDNINNPSAKMIPATLNSVKWEEVNQIKYRFQALQFSSDGTFYYPRRHTTSFQRRYDIERRRIDVETTSCIYRVVVVLMLHTVVVTQISNVSSHWEIHPFEVNDRNTKKGAKYVIDIFLVSLLLTLNIRNICFLVLLLLAFNRQMFARQWWWTELCLFFVYCLHKFYWTIILL